MARKILFFINPISGTKNKAALEKKIIAKCEHERTWFEILFTNKDGDYNFLPEKIKSDCITDIVICGGDGSLSPVISFLLNSDVNVGIIPLGSGNGLARTAGIPNNVDKALATIFTGEAGFVDAFLVNGRLGCQIAGLGFDAFIAAEFARERTRGLSTYTRLAIRHFFRARPYRFLLCCEDVELHAEAFILSIANANQFGNNLKIAPKALLNDGLLDVVVLKKTSKIDILISFVNHLLFAKKMARPSTSSTKNILYFNTSKLEIENKEFAPIHIDGDPVEIVSRLELRLLPSAYKLIRPA